MLAHHWTEAGEAGQAIEAWRTAAQRSAARSAYAETSAHYERALALLDQLPEEPERVQRELVLQLGLTDALQMAKGFGAPETIAAADRAKKLSEYLGDTQFRVRTLYNMWGTSMSSGEIMSSQVLADELVSLGTRARRRTVLVRGAHRSGRLALQPRPAHSRHWSMLKRSSTDPPRRWQRPCLPSGVIQAGLYGGTAAAVLGMTDRARVFLTEIVSARTTARRRSDRADTGAAQLLGSQRVAPGLRRRSVPRANSCRPSALSSASR